MCVGCGRIYFNWRNDTIVEGIISPRLKDAKLAWMEFKKENAKQKFYIWCGWVYSLYGYKSLTNFYSALNYHVEAVKVPVFTPMKFKEVKYKKPKRGDKRKKLLEKYSVKGIIVKRIK